MSKKGSFIQRIGKNLTSYTKYVLYKALVLPHVNFCASIGCVDEKWGHDLTTEISHRLGNLSVSKFQFNVLIAADLDFSKLKLWFTHVDFRR